MPELPEVETVKEGLKKYIIGKKISIFTVLEKKTFSGNIKAIVGKRVVSVRRRAKVIIINLSGGESLLIHLKMTGQLIYRDKKRFFVGGHPSKDMVATLPNNHTRIVVEFADGSTLYFNDLRKFGYVRQYRFTEVYQSKELAGMGIEALDRGITADYLYKKARNKKSLKIKQLLLDQRIIAGIGNIYADESLFCAGLSPKRLARNVTKPEFCKLAKCIVGVLTKGIRYGGTSHKDYVNIEGERGTMQDHLMVYRKTGEPCETCAGKIKRIVVGGRGTHYCPNCQR